MEKEPLPQSEAGRRFVKILINDCHEEIAHLVMRTLQAGPPGGEPPVNQIQMSNWFRSLQPFDQKQVQETIKYSLELCLFHLLNILDGTSPVRPMEQESDFAVCLQTYASSDDLDHGYARTSVRINPVFPIYESGGEQLHDIFSEIMEEGPKD